MVKHSRPTNESNTSSILTDPKGIMFTEPLMTRTFNEGNRDFRVGKCCFSLFNRIQEQFGTSWSGSWQSSISKGYLFGSKMPSFSWIPNKKLISSLNVSQTSLSLNNSMIGMNLKVILQVSGFRISSARLSPENLERGMIPDNVSKIENKLV